MAFNKAADKEGAPMKRRPMHRRKKVCVFCGKDNVIDYKNVYDFALSLYFRKLCKASESAHCSDQESTSRGIDAVRMRISFA